MLSLLVNGRLLEEMWCFGTLLCLQDFVACSTSGNFLWNSSMKICNIQTMVNHQDHISLKIKCCKLLQTLKQVKEIHFAQCNFCFSSDISYRVLFNKFVVLLCSFG